MPDLSDGFLGDVVADKAYLSRKYLRLVVQRGGTPYIPFKSNTTGDGRGSVLWEQLCGFFLQHRAEFLQHYHHRSMVESTFAMIKAKVWRGHSQQGRSGTGQRIAVQGALPQYLLCHSEHVRVGD